MSIQNLSGQMLSQYELRDLIGVGGMGAVYRGYQINLKREVAIKVLSPQLAQQSGYIERFNREAETSAALEHRHIIPIYDYGTQRGISYVVMRMLTGGTLADRLALHTEEHKPLPSLGEISKVLEQLASALDYAHSQGVIHRDIKPSNVMFDNQGSAYLVDFGIAKLMEATQSLTGTGATMGTPAYMAPEQWKAEGIGAATDQYALGVMIYTLVTGRVPFEAPTPYALMNKHLNEQPTPPQVIRPDVPQAVTDVLNRAMAKNTSNRFPTCAAFAQAFEKAIRGQTGEVTNFFATPVRRKTVMAAPSGAFTTGGGTGRPVHRHPLVWLMGAALLVMAAVIGFLVLSSGGDNKPTATPVAIGATATATTTPEPSTTPEDTPTLTETATVEPTLPIIAVITPTLTPSDTPTATPTPSHTPIPTATPVPTDTPTPTVTLTPSETPDLKATIDAEFYARLTLTAAVWTATPTSTNRPTITVTASFTPTYTPPPTLTPAPTDTPVPASGLPYAVPIGRNVAVLGTPSFTATVLGNLTAGDRVPITGISTDGKYYQVTANGLTGWVYALYVKVEGDMRQIPGADTSQAPVATPIGNNVAVRVEPGFTGVTLGNLMIGDRAPIIGISDDGKYYQVVFNQRIGWVYALYVKVEGDISRIPGANASPTPVPTDTPVPASGSPYAVPIGNNVAVRVEPGFTGTMLGNLLLGDRVPITGISDDGRYYQVTFDGLTGWVYAIYVRVEGDLSQIPGADTSPTPTATAAPAAASPAHPVVTEANADQMVQLQQISGDFSQLAWSPDGKTLALGGTGDIWLYDSENWDADPRVLRGHTDAVLGLMWSHDGTRLASGARDGTVRIWNVASGQATSVLTGHTDVVHDVAWSPDDARLASAGWDGTVRIWAVATGTQTQMFDPGLGQVHGVVWFPDGNRLALDGSGGVKVWDVEKNAGLLFLGYSMGMVASPDGAWIAIGSWEGPIDIFDAANGLKKRVLTGHTNIINDLEWNPAGTLLASASNDNAVKIWNTADGSDLITLFGHGAPVWSVAWSGDGSRLASEGADDNVRIWGLPAAPAAEATTVAVVKASGDIHTEPDGFAASLATVQIGERLTVLGVSQDTRFFEVDYHGQTGWIYRGYVTVDEPASAAAAPQVPVVETSITEVIVQSPGDIHTEPDGFAASLATVQIGERLAVLGVSQDTRFFEVDYHGQTGWIYRGYVTAAAALQVPVATLPPEIAAQVTGVQVNARTGPGIEYCVASVLQPGQKLVLLSQVSVTSFDPPEWYQFRADDGQTAWVWSDLVTISDGSASSIPDGSRAAAQINLAPVIHDIEIDGTCQGFTYIFKWSDADGNAAQIERANDAGVYFPVGGCADHTYWPSFYCDHESCADEWVIVDYDGNRSNRFTSTIDCNQ